MKKKLIFILVVLLPITLLSLLMSHFNRIPPINQTTKTCLITGASSGIGYELSKEMVKRGWKVIGIARRAEKLEALKNELGQSFIPYTCDVSKLEQIHSVSNQIKAHDLQPTLFFLNAGTGCIENTFQPVIQTHKETFDVNYFGVVAWVEEWLDTVNTLGGGTFIATSSVASVFASPSAGAYGASKAALTRCFQSFGLRYHKNNIGFSVIFPGPVDTAMLKADRSKIPFIHHPHDEATYIVDQVFKRKKEIKPSIFYYYLFKTIDCLPNALILKII